MKNSKIVVAIFLLLLFVAQVVGHTIISSTAGYILESLQKAFMVPCKGGDSVYWAKIISGDYRCVNIAYIGIVRYLCPLILLETVIIAIGVLLNLFRFNANRPVKILRGFSFFLVALGLIYLAMSALLVNGLCLVGADHREVILSMFANIELIDTVDYNRLSHEYVALMSGFSTLLRWWSWGALLLSGCLFLCFGKRVAERVSPPDS